MSNSCNIIVRDSTYSIQLYLHGIGHPEEGVLKILKVALAFAWELPRMEPQDFAAAIVAAAKRRAQLANLRGGIIRIDGALCVEGSWKLPEPFADYCYIIEPDMKAQKWAVQCFDGDKKMIFSGHVGDDSAKVIPFLIKWDL